MLLRWELWAALSRLRKYLAKQLVDLQETAEEGKIRRDLNLGGSSAETMLSADSH